MQREVLHNELRTLEVLSYVPAELAELYNILEGEFHPLDMVSHVSKSMRWASRGSFTVASSSARRSTRSTCRSCVA